MNRVVPRILIASAAYGGENVGDDAILAAIVEQLRAIEPETRITAVTRQPHRMAEKFEIEAIDIQGFANRIEAYFSIARHDALIVGGGALIAQYTDGLRGLVTGHPGFPLTMLFVAKCLGRFAMVYGAGVEDVSYRPARFLIRHVYDRANVITVRDEDSRVRLTQDLGVTRAPVITTADPVLAISIPRRDDASAILHRAGLDDDRDSVCVINFAYGADRRDELLDFMAKTADHAVSSFGTNVLFVPMNHRPDADRRGMEQVCDRMKLCGSASILDPPFDHNDVMAITRRAELVISSRMHLLIFAALTGTPIVGISRVPKVDAFLAHYGLHAGASTDDLDFDRFAPVLDESWRRRELIAARLRENREALREAALSNARTFYDSFERHRR